MSENPYEPPAPIPADESQPRTSSNVELVGFITFYGLVVIVAVISGIAIRLGVVPFSP